MSDKVAVVLAGCGVFDGSEVHEASAVCVALSRAGKKIAFFAPNKMQHHAINHINGEQDEQDRNVCIESARIAREKVHSISDLNADDYSAVIFPGGFGVAKNLCTFAVSENPEVDDDVVRVLRQFRDQKKPIGLCCIAPILAAMVFGSKDGIPVKITLGKRGGSDEWPYAGTIDKAAEFGASVEEMGVDEICVDEENKIVTTPAFMFNGSFFEIHDGVVKMVKKVVEMI